MKIETFEQLLAHAKRLRDANLHAYVEPDALAMATAIIDLLGEAAPCGMEPPPIVSLGNGSVGLLVDDRSDPLDVTEARAYAALVQRTADEAHELNG